MDPISSLEVTINTSKDSIIKFRPDQKEYEVKVPRDCFGLLMRLKYEPDFYISIRSNRDAGRFGFPDLDPEMGDYIAGGEIPYYDYYDGYIVRLDKREACFDEDLRADITIWAGSETRGEKEYVIHLVRECGKDVRSLFREGNFYDEEYQINMPYELYVPTNYNPKKKYPLVIGLHGTGEIQEPVSALLKKMEMATIWAEDSEKKHNQCIVLAPQCTIRYDEDDNWTTLNQFIHGRTDSPFWPMPQLTVVWRLIEKLREDYNIDKKRLYLTGVSSGAFGAYVLAMEHPGAFAGMVVTCGAGNPGRVDQLKGLPMWIFHSEDDPLIVPQYTLEPTLKAMDKAKIKYKLTLYPKGMVFWQTGHFCWEVAFKDKKMRDWLFSKGHPKKKKDAPTGDHSISEDGAEIAKKAISAAGGKDAIKSKNIKY